MSARRARRRASPRQTVYAWKRDVSIRAGVARGPERGPERAGGQAHRRAFQGSDKPVYHLGQQGWQGARKYSDTLAIFLLKAHDPEKYRGTTAVWSCPVCLDVRRRTTTWTRNCRADGTSLAPSDRRRRRRPMARTTTVAQAADRAQREAAACRSARAVNRLPIWAPLPGPQTQAYESRADVIGYGGAAGGGKRPILPSVRSPTQHRRVAIFRREATQLTGVVVDRLAEVLGTRDGYNGAERIWRGAGPRDVQIEFGSVPNIGDEAKTREGRKTLCWTRRRTSLESQVRFLMGWVRARRWPASAADADDLQPADERGGRWIVEFFGPWIDRRHPLYPTPPGALRYVAVIDGKDVWVGRPTPSSTTAR